MASTLILHMEILQIKMDIVTILKAGLYSEGLMISHKVLLFRKCSFKNKSATNLGHVLNYLSL